MRSTVARWSIATLSAPKERKALSPTDVIPSLLEVCNARQQAAIMELPAAVAALTTATTSETRSAVGRCFTDREICTAENEVASLQSELLRHAATIHARDALGTSLEGRRLSGLDLKLSKLSTTFNRADLTSSCLDGAFISDSTFNLALLNRVSAIDARFHHTTFVGAEMRAMVAQSARFSKCVFHRCDMSGWIASGAVFVNCDFYKCDMQHWIVDGQTTFVGTRDTTWETCNQSGWKQSDASLKAFGVQDVQFVHKG